MPMLPTIQITICTWNRAGLLRQTLESACALTWPDSHLATILVVNNNSTDDTSQVVRGFTDRLPVREVFEPTPGHTTARNRALTETNADFVLWTDDDVLFDKDWLIAFCDATSRWPDAAVFGGPCRPWFPIEPDSDLTATFPALALGYCVRGYDGPDGPIPFFEPQHLMGMNFGVRMAGLRDLRFDPTLGYSPTSITGGDETDYIRRALAQGARAAWVSRMHVQHYVSPERMTLQYLKRFTIGNARRAANHSADASHKFHTLARWCATEYLAYLRDRLAGRRRAALGHLKRCWHLRGIMSGLRHAENPL
jgi:glycosyltransferase involved in cell wall biosynthesis